MKILQSQPVVEGNVYEFKICFGSSESDHLGPHLIPSSAWPPDGDLLYSDRTPTGAVLSHTAVKLMQAWRSLSSQIKHIKVNLL